VVPTQLVVLLAVSMMATAVTEAALEVSGAVTEVIEVIMVWEFRVLGIGVPRVVVSGERTAGVDRSHCGRGGCPGRFGR
jgi:hypothetical protein